MKRGNRPPFLSRPIFIQLVSRGQSISPITSSRSWHVPHPRHAGSTPKGAPPHPLPPPPLPLFKFNFSAECIESTLPPERHLVSFSFSSFSSFLESLSPHLLREEIFVFFLFFFRMLEKKFFCFEFHYSKRYRRARDLPRVFKKTVTSRWAPPSRSESKSIEFERFRSKTCSTQIKGRELFIIHWWEPRPARLNDPSHRKHDEISNSFFINRETQFPSFRSKDSGCAVDDSNRRSASYRLDPVSSKKMKSWRSKKVFFETSSSLLIRTWFEERILLFKTKKRNNATRFRKFYSTKQNTSL